MKKVIILLFAITCTTQLFAQGTMYIGTGANVIPSGATYIVFNNTNLVNNGTYQSTGGSTATTEFVGNTNVAVSGTGSNYFDHLAVAMGSSTNLSLQSGVNIVDDINFTSGLLNVGNNAVTLGAGAVLLNESEVSRAYSTGTTGYIQSTGTLNAPSSVNLGNLGAIITSSSNLGSTTIQRTFNTFNNLSNGNIFRDYVITPTNDAGLNATFRFKYFDAELNGENENLLDMLQSPDNGTTWNDLGATTRDNVNNYVENTGINSFSTWTLTPPSTVLSATMGALNAYQINNNNIDVDWQVYAEINVATYDIQKSTDGKNFKTIGQLDAVNAGGYTYTDANAVNGDNFYRLLIVDKDGTIKYSNIDKVTITNAAASISFYPNPVVDRIVTLQLTNVTKGSYQLVMFDDAGKQVYTSVINNAGGSSTQTIYLPQGISTGVYKVQLKNNQTIFNESLLVK
jgi:hypothetical protein